MTVYQNVIDAAVDEQSENRQFKRDFYCLDTAESSQKNLCHCKKQVSAQAAMLQATMIWFASFTVLPAPLTSPQ